MWQPCRPAISGNRGHDATFAVAAVLVHGFAFSRDLAWPIMLEFNARCDPPWSEKDLDHKLDDATKLARHSKPRGYLLGERGPATPPQSKPVVMAFDVDTSEPLPGEKRQPQPTADATPLPLPQPPELVSQLHGHLPQVEAKSAQAPQNSIGAVPEAVDHFVEEIVILEDGALCAFHHLFARYRKWRVSYGLLATRFSEEQFALAIQSHGVKTDFERQLFFDVYARLEATMEPERSEDTEASVRDGTHVIEPSQTNT